MSPGSIEPSPSRALCTSAAVAANSMRAVFSEASQPSLLTSKQSLYLPSSALITLTTSTSSLTARIGLKLLSRNTSPGGASTWTVTVSALAPVPTGGRVSVTVYVSLQPLAVSMQAAADDPHSTTSEWPPDAVITTPGSSLSATFAEIPITLSPAHWDAGTLLSTPCVMIPLWPSRSFEITPLAGVGPST